MTMNHAFRWLWLLFTANFVSSNAPNIDYSHNMRILKLPKNVNPGTLIYRLKGSHPDAKALTFGVREAFARKLFEIKASDFRSADVYLRSPLTDTEYNLTIFVTDGSKTTQVQSTILVTESDTALVSPFLDYQTIYTINEVSINTQDLISINFVQHKDSPRNSTIGYLVAKDRDSSNLPVIFELRGSDHFAIRYVFGPKGSSKAVITLVKDVNYERRNIYPMTVVALNAWTNETIDTRNVATIDIIIVVKDAEDEPPKFIDLPPVVQISEELPAGSVITTITAIDGDYEINRKIGYSFAPSPLVNHFMIHRSNGSVVLKSSASMIKNSVGLQSPFILTIRATEIVPTNEIVNEKLITNTVEIAFVLVALENRPPEFASSLLSGFIEENSPIMTAVRWNNFSLPRVSDQDSGLNGTMDLTLSSDQFFTVQQNYGLREITFSLLSKSLQLDYETGPREIVLIITAKDHSPTKPLFASIPCKVSIVDLNDNNPHFLQQEYRASIYEDAAVGTKVAKVEATDKDSGLFGQIKYTSINGPIAKNLLLNQTTGLITLKSTEGIDREAISEYTLTIEARDENGFGNRNVTRLTVKILDANDNEPKFVQPRYDAVLNPDMVTFTQPLVVKAVDADQSNTLNGQVVYEVIGGNYQGKFYINNATGEIMIRTPLTFEKSTKFVPPYGDKSVEVLPNIVLTVRAHDRGIPYRYSTVKVYIHSKDFLNRTVSFIIEEDESKVWSKKDEIQSLTGAEVHVYSVRPLPSNTKMTRIDTWISYPLHSSVDLRNLGKLVNKMQLGDVSDQDNVQTASFYKSNYDLVIWIILLLIFITLLFLIVLICIWCICYRSERKSGKNRSRFEATSNRTDFENGLVNGKSGVPVRAERITPIITTGVGDTLKYWKRTAQEKGRSSRHSSSSDEPSRMQKIKMSRHQRTRIAPEYLETESPVLIDAVEDPEYVLMKRSRVNKRRIHADAIFREVPRANPGAYVIDESGHNYYMLVPNDDGNRMGLTPHGTYRLGRAESLREEHSKRRKEKFRSASELGIRNHRDDYLTAGPSSLRASKGHLSDQDQHSLRKHSVDFRGGYRNDAKRLETRVKRPTEPNTASASLPGSIEGDDAQLGRPSSDTSEIDMGLIDGVVFGVADSRSRTLARHNQNTAIKTVKVANDSDKSDSDSGIGRSRMERKLNLKNSDLMTKKSIFTIAFDEVKTDRINSAESVSSPPLPPPPPLIQKV